MIQRACFKCIVLRRRVHLVCACVRVRARVHKRASLGKSMQGKADGANPSFLGDYLKCMGSAGNWVSLILNGATVAERSHPVNIPQHSHIPALVCQDPGPSHAAPTPVERLHAGACETTPHSRTHYFFFFFSLPIIATRHLLLTELSLPIWPPSYLLLM